MSNELIEYLKIRKEAQTEIEIKNIMSKIYKSIATNSKLFYAFSSSIPPKMDDNDVEEFDDTTVIKPALIYSEKAEPYLPLYTTIEEAKNRGTIEQYPYVKALDFLKFAEMIMDEYKRIEGIVINPFSDNLVLNKQKVQYLLNLRRENDSELKEKKSPNIESVKEDINLQSTKIIEKVSLGNTNGTYMKSSNARKKGILVNEYDLRILEYNVLPSRVIKVAISFAKENPSISALWIFDKRYYLPNDNTQYLGQLIVVEDNLSSEEEKLKLYSLLRDRILPQSNANEVFVESIDSQKKDFVRKNVIIPFYQKANIF